MANTFLSYRDQVKRIKEKGASCECKNETQCKIEENLEKLLQTNNYTRVFTPLKHTFLDIEQQELNQQVKIFNDETKKPYLMKQALYTKNTETCLNKTMSINIELVISFFQ